MHSTMKRGEPCRQVYIVASPFLPPPLPPPALPPRLFPAPGGTDNNRSNQRETTREDSKSGRALGARVSTLAAESNFVECHPRDLGTAVAVQRSAFERSNRSIAISSQRKGGEGREEGRRSGARRGRENGGGCAVRFPRRAPRRSIEPPDRAGYNIFFIWSRGSSLWRVFRAGSGQCRCTG